MQTEIQLLVSPNPAFSKANIIVLIAKDFNSPMEISITDVSGRIVFRKNISDAGTLCPQFQFSSRDLASGLYFIKALSENNLLAIEKLLVQ